MKVLAALLVFAFVAVSHQQKQKFEDVKQGWVTLFDQFKSDCVAESNVDVKVAEKMVDSGEFPDDATLKCYSKCIFVKHHALNAENVVEVPTLRKLVGLNDEALVDKVMEKCGAIKEADPCETVFGVCKCIFPTVKELLA